MSFKRYTALEIKQNKKNPKSVRKNGSGENNCLSKINAKNTKPFFVHWRRRMALMRAFNMRLFYLIEVQYVYAKSSSGCAARRARTRRIARESASHDHGRTSARCGSGSAQACHCHPSRFPSDS